MVKTLTPDLVTAFGQTTTTIATLWHVTRTDTVEFFFTDHDADLVFEGDTYVSAAGYTRSASDSDVGFAVNNLNVDGFFSDDALTDSDMRAGKFDYAAISVFVVDYTNLSAGAMKSSRGTFGEVIFSNSGMFSTEIRGLNQAYTQNIVEVYQSECRANLGDHRCRIPLVPPIVARNTAYLVGDFVRAPAVLAGLTGGAYDTAFDALVQTDYNNRIFRCVFAGTTNNTSQPTYDDTALTAAANVLTITSTASLNGQTVTLGSKTYTFRSAATPTTANDVHYTSVADAATNLIGAVNADSALSGTGFGSATVANADVTGTTGGVGIVKFAGIVAGTVGNALVASETLTSGSFSDAGGFLVGGVNAIPAGVAASNTLTIALATSLNNETVTFGSVTYTYKSALTGAANEVKFTNSTDAATNLISALNGSAGAGTTYGTGTVANPAVSGKTGGSGKVVASARVPGTGGNSLTATETLTDAGNVFSNTGGTLVGGVGDTDGSAVFLAVQSWTRAGTVLDEGDGNRVFTVLVDEPRSMPGLEAIENAAELTLLQTIVANQQANEPPGITISVRGGTETITTIITQPDGSGITETITTPLGTPALPWFTGGVVIWETGANAGLSMEVKNWTAKSNTVELFLGMPFEVQAGDTFAIYPGCSKLITACSVKFDDVLNMRAEPYVPGQDAMLRIPNPPAS